MIEEMKERMFAISAKVRRYRLGQFRIVLIKGLNNLDKTESFIWIRRRFMQNSVEMG